jgi:hypothetical protein
MITREQLETALGDDNNEVLTQDIDHAVTAINLLRDRIPYSKVKNIIAGAEHDVVYLCDTEDCLPFLNEDDLKVLVECNVWVDNELDTLALFV